MPLYNTMAFSTALCWEKCTDISFLEFNRMNQEKMALYLSGQVLY